jgi:Galactosyltransferase.
MVSVAVKKKTHTRGGYLSSRKRQSFLYLCCVFVCILMIYGLTVIYHFKLTELETSVNFESLLQRGHHSSTNSNSKSFISHFGSFELTYNLIKSLALGFIKHDTANLEIVKTPVTKLVRKSQDTGMFLHNDRGQLLCGTRTLKVLILITSNYYELDIRMKIRKTWADKHASTARYVHSNGRYMEFKWRNLFVIGGIDESWSGRQFVETETRMQPDILEVEIQEHGTKKAPKLYSALRWVLNNCNFQYIMYTTAQHFVNLPALYNFLHLESIRPIKKLYAGNVIEESVKLPSLVRGPGGHIYLEKARVSYVTGNSAILSRDALREVIDKLAYLSVFTSLNQNIMIAASMKDSGIKPYNVTRLTKQLQCNDMSCCNNEKNFVQILIGDNANCINRLYLNYN